MQNQVTSNEKDPHLWEIAKRRASFKYHLLCYILFNAFFWVLWTFNGQHGYSHNGLPWPVWPMMGWGIGVLFHFLGAYVFSGRHDTEKEYEKLIRNRK